MSVIAELRAGSGSFELGRTLENTVGGRVEFETLVPLGERSIPLVWIYDGFEADDELPSDGTGAADVERLDSYEDRTLVAVDWAADHDPLLEAIRSHDGQLIAAAGAGQSWEFEVRFPGRDALSAFQEFCAEEGIDFEVRRVYNPRRPEADPWFGLTDPQREAVVLAHEMGYFEIPREHTTAEVADRLDISDQALTERLRRATTALIENALLAPGSTPDADEHHG
ncbi:MAG: helix-turn-helix domain-containing protein [Halobacteriales archaeon]